MFVSLVKLKQAEIELQSKLTPKPIYQISLRIKKITTQETRKPSKVLRFVHKLSISQKGISVLDDHQTPLTTRTNINQEQY